MSRKSALQTITAPGFSHSTPSPRTSSSLIGEMPSTHNPYVLQDEIIPGKTPYTRRHHGKSSGLGLGSAGGGGKDGRSGGKNGIGGGNQGQTDDDSESSSGQDDEEADDDEDDEDDDEDDEAEEPAVSGPVRVDGDDIASGKSFLMSQSTVTSKTNDIIAKGDHRAGPESRKRSFSTAMESEESNDEDEDTASSINGGDETGVQTDGDEPDYPRKRAAAQLSNTNGLLTYAGPPSVVTDDTNAEDDDEDDDEGTLITDDDFEDEDIENIEEAAIIQELQTPIKPAPVVYDCEYGLENTDLITAEELEDLDNEVFNVQWHNPDLFADINLSNDYGPYSDPFASVELEGGLFPENGSAISTPFATPTTTPRGSFSTAPPSGPSSPKCSFSDTSLGDNLNSESEDDAADLNPFFERDDPVLKHIVSTQGKGGWADDTDDENGLWKHFFSEGETYGSSDEFEEDSEDGSEEEEEDCETDDGETTDEEENLPMPTPRSKSMLRRASISSVSSARPQVVHVDDSSTAGPTLGSWVADPTRTICVIDGAKRTFLVPGGAKGYSIGDTSDNSALSQLMMMEESESEKSSVQMGYNPTLSGLTGGDGLFLNGSDILGPPEAFYPLGFDDLLGLEDLGDDLIADDEEVDEFEQDLQITDFLDFSTDDGNDDHAGCNNSDGDYEDGDEDDDECIPAADSSEAMLALWDHVAVTSFRKRQIQHAQGHHASSSTTPNTTKDRRLSQTITPARKKKLKQKYLAKSAAGTGLRKKIASKKSGASFGTGNQWSPLFEDL